MGFIPPLLAVYTGRGGLTGPMEPNSRLYCWHFGHKKLCLKMST